MRPGSGGEKTRPTTHGEQTNREEPVILEGPITNALGFRVLRPFLTADFRAGSGDL